mgnify:CR=1 FL=1
MLDYNKANMRLRQEKYKLGKTRLQHNYCDTKTIKQI